jgi:cysteinyl-tRNA synthetase
MKYLGQTFDIHGGGLDLQFPHHENELAQSESFSGKTFARYWMHNGLLKMGDAKMAGSVGNVVNVVDLLSKHHPETVRFLLLSTHYRSPIEWSSERLLEVKKALDGFYRFFERYERITRENFYAVSAVASAKAFDISTTGKSEAFAGIVAHYQRFREVMEDDFNTGAAIGVLFELLSKINKFAEDQRLEQGAASEGPLREFREAAIILRTLGNLLGLFAEPIPKGGDDALVNGLMQLLIDLRADARKTKNFALGDQIRKRLTDLGVTLEDRPGGTIWRVG